MNPDPILIYPRPIFVYWSSATRLLMAWLSIWSAPTAEIQSGPGNARALANAPAAPAHFSLEPVARWLSGDFRALETRREEILRMLGHLPPAPLEQQSDRLGYHSRFSGDSNAVFWIALDLGKVERLDAVVLAPCDVAYAKLPGPGYGFPTRFKVELAVEDSFTNATVLADYTARDFPNPGDLPVYIPAAGARGRYLRVVATRLWPRGDAYLFALSEIMALQGNRNIAIGAPVRDNSDYENPPAWRTQNATDGQSVLGPPVLIERAPGNGYHSVENSLVQDRVGWVQIDLGRAMKLDEVRLFPARPSDFPARRGFGFPVRFRVDVSNDPEFRESFCVADHAHEDFMNPAENPVSFRIEGVTARYARVTATRWWHRNRDYVFALGEMAVYSGDTNVAPGAKVTSDTKTEFSTWRNEYLVDGYSSQGRIVEWPQWLQGLSQRREALWQLASLNARRDRLFSAILLEAAGWTAAVTIILILLFLVAAYRMRLRRLREVDLLRARIAADLHDEIGSNVGSIALLSRLMNGDKSISSESQQSLQEINRTAVQTLESMREIVWLIHPGHDQIDELADRLREFSRNMLAGVECSFEAPAEKRSTRLSLNTRRNVYLIFKEILHNIVKHARARHVRISLRESQRVFQLTVSDDGIGFDPAQILGGHGLPSVRQRAEQLGGKLRIATRPGAGTEVSLTMQIS
jgi:signal transduction histidine kinase